MCGSFITAPDSVTGVPTRLPKVIALLRDPSIRLWVAFWNYGQYPAKYGKGSAGFAAYFGNQSQAFQACEMRERNSRRCALRLSLPANFCMPI